jgi:hypothetical protein
MHDTSLRQFRLTRNAVLVDLESAAKECSSNGRERVEDAVGPMLWVKRRGNLEDGGFQSKCNGPNGLSLKLINIQSLESYQLDDLPAGGGNAAAKRLARLHFNL